MADARFYASLRGTFGYARLCDTFWTHSLPYEANLGRKATVKFRLQRLSASAMLGS